MDKPGLTFPYSVHTVMDFGESAVPSQNQSVSEGAVFPAHASRCEAR